MSDNSILAAIAALRFEFLSELGKTRADIMEKVAELQADVTRIRDEDKNGG